MLPISSMIPNHHRPPGRFPRNSDRIDLACPPISAASIFFPATGALEGVKQERDTRAKVLRTGPAPEFSPTRPDVRRVRLSTCRPCGIQMSTVGDGRDHEGHDEQHRQGYGLRREDSPPGPVHRVTARCSKAVSASRQRPYQTHRPRLPPHRRVTRRTASGRCRRESVCCSSANRSPVRGAAQSAESSHHSAIPPRGVRPVKTFARARGGIQASSVGIPASRRGQLESADRGGVAGCLIDRRRRDPAR